MNDCLMFTIMLVLVEAATYLIRPQVNRFVPNLFVFFLINYFSGLFEIRIKSTNTSSVLTNSNTALQPLHQVVCRVCNLTHDLLGSVPRGGPRTAG